MKVFLDCDPGVDDALALGLILGTPGVELLGVSIVCGNVAVNRGAVNALALLEQAGRVDIPVAVGCSDYSDRPFDGGVPHIHGDDGCGNFGLQTSLSPVEKTGPELLIETLRKYPGEVDVVAVGPLTNLAAALELDPEISTLAKSLHIMGGAFWVGGNISPHGEANIWHDVKAAAKVFQASWSGTISPLDATLKTVFTAKHLEKLAASSSKFCKNLAQICEFYCRFYEQTLGYYGCALHDPLAVAAALGILPPYKSIKAQVSVDLEEESWGRTRAWSSGKMLAAPADMTWLECQVNSALTPENETGRYQVNLPLNPLAPIENAGTWDILYGGHTDFPDLLIAHLNNIP